MVAVVYTRERSTQLVYHMKRQRVGVRFSDTDTVFVIPGRGEEGCVEDGDGATMSEDEDDDDDDDDSGGICMTVDRVVKKGRPRGKQPPKVAPQVAVQLPDQGNAVVMVELGSEGLPKMLTMNLRHAVPSCFVIADFMLRHPWFQINNKPTGSVCRHVRGLGALCGRRSDIARGHLPFTAFYRGFRSPLVRKGRAWGGPTISTFMTTDMKDVSNNGGPNATEHIANAWRHALFASATNSPFVYPCRIAERDPSVSMVLPCCVDTDALVAAFPARWARNKNTFAGAIGTPSDWNMNGKVIVFPTGTVLYSMNAGNYVHNQLALRVIAELMPFFVGLNVDALTNRITNQQTAFIIPNDTPPVLNDDGSDALARLYTPPSRPLAVYGDNRLAMYAPRPDQPITRLPVPREATHPTVAAFVDAMEDTLRAMAAAEAGPAAHPAGRKGRGARSAREPTTGSTSGNSLPRNETPVVAWVPLPEGPADSRQQSLHIAFAGRRTPKTKRARMLATAFVVRTQARFLQV
jgi:hypothetical protein